MRKVYYVSVTPNGNNKLFRRNSYSLIEGSGVNMHLTLIHYLGDEKTATDYPHGNSKCAQPKPFMRTCPSVLKSLSGTNELPSAVYKKAIAINDCRGDHQPVLKPRNCRQIANLQFKERQRLRLTHSLHINQLTVYILINMYKISMHLNSNLRSIIENGCISHNHKLGVFTVVGTSGNPHAVKLFPKESCTCPSTSQCYHILAARISVGLEPTTSQKKINLTQLRQKTRSRRDKKSGRKAPRPGDYEVIPAPDAKSLVSYYCHCVAMCTPSVSTGYLACKY